MKKCKRLLQSLAVLALITSGCSHSSPDMVQYSTNYDNYYTDDFNADKAFNTNEYSEFIENNFVSTKNSPLSTFSADVDTASYTIFRMHINQGSIPENIALRSEEMVNYFKYDYPEPKENEPFSITTEIAPCPWNKDTKLLRIGAKTHQVDLEHRLDSNIVFLLDVSGSMSDDLELVKKSLLMFIDNLSEKDRISIVTYADGDRVVLNGAKGSDKQKIQNALSDIRAGGSTNGSAGIQRAYEIAKENFITNGNNRVILATDGDLNVGITSENELKALIENKRETGIFLSVLGFGWGNIKDNKMETLADYGNGSYHYIDNLLEAKRILVDEFTSTTFVAAKDVKFQIDFNSAKIKGYRQIGYETRKLNAEEFADDKVDGGEIGANTQITALYEIVEVGSAFEIPEADSKYNGNSTQNDNDGSSDDGNSDDSSFNDDAKSNTDITENDNNGVSLKYDNCQGEYCNELLTINLRYKEPAGDTSKLLEYPVKTDIIHDKASEDLGFAATVVEVTMLLNGSKHKGNASYEGIIEQLDKLESVKKDEYRGEFKQLVLQLISLLKNKE